MTASFTLGRLLATPAAIDALGGVGVAPLELIRRHAAGDWGDLDPDDLAANEHAIADGSRIFSAYQLTPELRVWVITEAADAAGRRPATTVLLPEDY